MLNNPVVNVNNLEGNAKFVSTFYGKASGVNVLQSL